MKLLKFYIDDIIKRALNEDINYIDISTDFLIPEKQKNKAYFIAKSDGVLCGIDIAMRVFELLDKDFEYKKEFNDGDEIKKGDVICEFEGHTSALLKGERTALNIIQHMSGISTATKKAVELVSGTKAIVCDTRKTLPGLRALEKYAVTAGGGKNHRYNLSDCIMLKDNHIEAAGGITEAVSTIKNKIGHTVKIEVETSTLDEVSEAAAADVDIIMLDNMDYATMKKAVEIINGRAKTEASGGITLENITYVAQCGVNIISLGALTHSVKAFDISMKIKK
ncbi:MAG: carboxylating nicotinate-nucleotide diphosphorylase [Candidatus Fimenecus sp.]